MHNAHTLLLDHKQTIVLLIGSLVPMGGYVVNRFAPWTNETVKGAVQVLLAAVAGALYIALDNGTLGLNSNTLQLIGSSVLAALAAHHWFYKPAKVNEKLGATETAPVRE